MFHLFVFCILVLTLGSCENPYRKDPQGKIIGGTDTTIEKYPYQLSLRIGGNHACGASLIAPNIVLTAAHCFKVLLELSYYTITAGNTNYNDDKNLQEVAHICRHPKYNPDGVDYDVAVLKLKKPYKLTPKIQTIRLPKPGGPELKKGDIGVVTGWGTTVDSEEVPPKVLQKVEVPYIPRKQCKAIYSDAEPPAEINDHMICFGYLEGEKDACQGDSGGPIVHKDIQVGIVSWAYGCAQPYSPGVYTDISNPDIYKHIKNCTTKFSLKDRANDKSV